MAEDGLSTYFASFQVCPRLCNKVTCTDFLPLSLYVLGQMQGTGQEEKGKVNKGKDHAFVFHFCFCFLTLQFLIYLPSCIFVHLRSKTYARSYGKQPVTRNLSCSC
jgi:hypothetical protein